MQCDFQKTLVHGAKKLLLAALMVCSPLAYADATWLSGTISDYTSTTEGLLIRIGVGAIPSNCASGNSYGWLWIPEKNKTIVATTLMLIAQGKLNVTVYTTGVVEGDYCRVIQVDPTGL